MGRWVGVVGVCVLLVAAVSGRAQEPRAQRNLIANPGFEQIEGERATGWAPFEQGYRLAGDVRRGGVRAIHCVNATPAERRGATYTLELNQKEPAPILVTGYSRAENVDGGANTDYAIYLDLEYMDGTPLWGQTAPFAAGTHDWQRRQVVVVPTKPVKRVSIHALFRQHAGSVWFDDFAAYELSGEGVFDSLPIDAPKLSLTARSGWFVRDVAASSAIVPASAANTLGLTVTPGPSSRSGASVTVRDTLGKPRAVTVTYVERFPGPNVTWWNDIRSSLPAGVGERANLTRAGAIGATGSISLYPFGCVTRPGAGRMLGIPALDGPRAARIGYHAAAGLLYVAFDVALTGDCVANSDGQGHGFAKLAVQFADTDPAWGFRSAAERYYALNPEGYDRRAKAEGLWIPFADPSKVERVEDFGIAYHEGDNSIASDDKLGILSFRYTEPMTWWMSMSKETPRKYDVALDMVRKIAADPKSPLTGWAQAVLNSCARDEDGRCHVDFIDAPWSNGATWALNPNPRLPHKPGAETKASISYTPEIAERMYGPGAKGVQDGEYLDSIEGWADVLDFGADAIRYSAAPPTFASDSLRPVVPIWFAVHEFAAYLREDLRKRGKLLMANATPWRVHAFAPLLDVLGTETNWNPDGTWRPDSDAVFNLRRVLCKQKPYLLLQNTDFDKFGVDKVEKYFQRSLFYGVFPSMFSVDAANNPYWETPRWYNRDRELFKRYVPAVKTLSAAGWEPITHARSSSASIYVERFGRDYLTVLNDGKADAEAVVTIDLPAFTGAPAGSGTVRFVDVVTGKELGQVKAARSVMLTVRLKPEEARAVRVMR